MLRRVTCETILLVMGWSWEAETVEEVESRRSASSSDTNLPCVDLQWTSTCYRRPLPPPPYLTALEWVPMSA